MKTAPYMQTGNAHLLPIDRKDPSLVLYLPLWYPYSDMSGSTIYSYDSARIASTVTNATWGYQGRTFDGTGDYIEGTNTATMNFTTGDFSILVWANPTNTTGGRHLFVRGLINTDGYIMNLGGTDRLEFYSNQAAANQGKYATNNSVLLGSWHLYSITCTSLAIAHYRDATNITSSAGTITAPATCARTFKIGCNDGKAGAFMLGGIGEVMVFSKALSAGEIASIHQKTKWRYS